MMSLKRYRLGDITEYISRGISPSYCDEGVRVINQKCIRNFKISLAEARFTNPNIKKICDELNIHNNYVSAYSDYVKNEISFVPLIPVILVFLYGSALIVSNSFVMRSLFLGTMIFFVTYLSKATHSSITLSIDKPNLDSMISELKDLKELISGTNERI